MLKAPTKITLKNTTKMTLNARFTSIMKSRPAASPQTIKAQVSTEKLASEKNRKLALQMENRHSASTAALPPAQPAKLSVRDRLGAANKGSAKARLSTFTAGTAYRGRGTLRGRVHKQTFSTRGKGVRGGKVGAKGTGVPGNRFSRGSFPKRGGFRGKRGGRGGRNTPVDKSKLDTDLDSYMSKTRGSMDAELDAYMANTGED